MQELINRAKELLADGTVVRVLGWRRGDMAYNPEVAYFNSAEELSEFVYDGFCGANLSKYMIYDKIKQDLIDNETAYSVEIYKVDDKNYFYAAKTFDFFFAQEM